MMTTNSYSATTPLDLSVYNVLIVDDAPVNLGVIVAFLESYGLGIRIARSGESALRRVQYDLPDLILLDVQMPNIDGFETCRQLKAEPQTRDIPVIFMTSLTSIEDKVKGFEAGAVDYVTKPLHKEEVLARITTHLQLRELSKMLQSQNQLLQITTAQEKARLFEAVSQQREQLRTLTARLTEVQESERKQLARELHDEMGQALTAISINLAAVEQELNTAASDQIKVRLAESNKLAAKTLEQVREMSLNLRPPMLDDLGLVPTLRWFIKRFAKRVDIQAELLTEGVTDRLAPEIETTLYRIVQEGLTNVTRHAAAQQVDISLTQTEDRISLTVTDNGRGFDLQKALSDSKMARSAGLLGIRERVTLLNGNFEIQTQPQAGTTLSIVIPLARQ